MKEININILKNNYSWEEIREVLTKLIYIFMPIGIIWSTKIYMRFALPLLIITVGIEIYKSGFKKSFYEKYTLLWLLSLIISVAFSNYDRAEGVEYIKENILYWIFLPTLLGQLKLKEENFKIFLMSSYFSCCFLFWQYANDLMTFYYKFVLKNKGWLEKVLGKDTGIFWNMGTLKFYRLPMYIKKGHFYHLSIVGAFLTIMVIISVVYIYKTRDKIIYKIVAGVFGGISFIFLLLTQSRAGYLSLISVLILLILLKLRENSWKVLVPLGIVGLGIIIKFSNNPFVKRVKQIGAIETDSSIKIRFDLYKESLRLFKENFFSGVGLQNFLVAQNVKNYLTAKRPYWHSHNMTLKLLSETGIFGFLSYFFMMFTILIKLFKYLGNVQCLIAFSSLMAFLIFENFEILLLKKYLHSYLFILIGIGINFYYKGE